MPREQNFLLGQGERLTAPEIIKKGSSPKNLPYSFPTAQRRTRDSLDRTLKVMQALPRDACPNDEAVAVVTLHPRFLSKSEFPADLIDRVGLRTIGSRSKRVQPDQWGVEKHGDDALTSELFVAGPRDAFANWRTEVGTWTPTTPGGASKITQLEGITALAAAEKIRAIPSDPNAASILEVVLHNANSESIVEAFLHYATAHGGEPLVERRRDIQGLTFIPVRAAPRRATELAAFAFVRVARGMPSLRPFRPRLIRATRDFDVRLPTEGCVDTVTRAVVFDGGLPSNVRKSLSQWVNLIEPLGIGKAHPDYEEHGLGVTTAFLFGPLAASETAGRPICAVDHVRVLDDHTGVQVDYYDVLDRITKHLDDHTGVYKLVNISLGPKMAVDDDDVTLWTASLDRRFAHPNVLATVAAGNDGLRDHAARLNRVQPPADGVNVLSVGSTDSIDEAWNRADYSCVGPGRCPGVVKPDGVMFGGSTTQGFGILNAQGVGTNTEGTSFAAPFALRSAAAVRAQLDERLSPLAIRALLVHRAEPHSHSDWQEVGWGRFERDGFRLITCDDNEALVVYQGELPTGQHLRAQVPLPKGTLKGFVHVTATLVIAPQVDPQHPDAYTRAGLEGTFRPHANKFGKAKDGRTPAHPKTMSFFSEGRVYGDSESALREDGHKWEPCLKSTRRFRADSLFEPCFDIYYHHRDAGGPNQNPLPIPYALIVSLSAPKVPDLYNLVVRAYRTTLSPLKPRTRIHTRT